MISNADLISFLDDHRIELHILMELARQDAADEERRLLQHRIECVDELLRRCGVAQARTWQ
jgi:hypothetical protein